jgi:hypothetical protein
MTSMPTELWSWLAVVGLGLFHGVNPAMGWLFAVALGLHRQSQRAVFLSLLPISIGHAVAVGMVAMGPLILGLMVDPMVCKRVAGVALLAFASWHAAYGHRRRLRVGMQTGLAGLLLWSFLMANAHGAGLMLIPVLLTTCLSGSAASELTVSNSIPAALSLIGVHTGTMLATIAVVSVGTYNWMGVAVLRRGWVNLDLLWIIALGICGLVLLAPF